MVYLTKYDEDINKKTLMKQETNKLNEEAQALLTCFPANIIISLKI